MSFIPYASSVVVAIYLFMCLIAIAWRAHTDLPLVVAANRDEWRDRPAEAAHWWSEEPHLLAGRDLTGGGTWMGITKSGRFAAITNFRDPSERRSTAPSRGKLVTDFLLGTDPPAIFLARLVERAAEYNAFNLIAGDRTSLYYFGSHGARLHEVPPGVHGLSNHVLDEPWPKVVRAREAMDRALASEDPSPTLFEMLSDASVAEDRELPDTGIGLEWERLLSPPLITGAAYGTRASTVLTVRDDGQGSFEERTRSPEGETIETRTFAFAWATHV